MKKDELLTVFGTHDIRTLPECIMSLLFGDQEVRDDVFRELIRCHAGDLSYDWFQEVYEEELSERRKKGQDFTPREVSMLETQLTGAREGVIHEPTAGTAHYSVLVGAGIEAIALAFQTAHLYIHMLGTLR